MRHLLAGRRFELAELHWREAATESWRTIHFLVGIDPVHPGMGARFLSGARQARSGGRPSESSRRYDERVAIDGGYRGGHRNEAAAKPAGAGFSIQETPRALHQPYLAPNGMPKDQFFTEPTGVFNTAELLINQVGLTPGVMHGDGPGLHLLLNHYVEDVQNHGDHFELVTRNTLNNQVRIFRAVTVVLAAGSIESPKLLRRSSMYPSLPESARSQVGRGLTDHPTSNEIATYVTNIDNVPISKNSHAKIVFYSRGIRDNRNQTRYPFNIEMNINHEY